MGRIISITVLLLAGFYISVTNAELPEDRDWSAFIQKGKTNYDMKMNGDEAIRLLDIRIDDLVREYSQACDEQARVLFLVNQELWKAAAESKAHLYGDNYRGGSHAGLAYRYALVDEYLERIRELKEINRYLTEP